MDIELVLNDLYKRLVKEHGWNLNDIDETNIETLFDFLFMEKYQDKNVAVIHGKEYMRAAPGKAPEWL